MTSFAPSRYPHAWRRWALDSCHSWLPAQGPAHVVNQKTTLAPRIFRSRWKANENADRIGVWRHHALVVFPWMDRPMLVWKPPDLGRAEPQRSPISADSGPILDDIAQKLADIGPESVQGAPDASKYAPPRTRPASEPRTSRSDICCAGMGSESVGFHGTTISGGGPQAGVNKRLGFC